MADSRSRSPRRSPQVDERRDRSRSRSKERTRRRSASPARRRSPEAKAAESERPRSPPRGPKKTDNSKGFKWKKKGAEEARGRDDRDFRRGDTDSYKPSRYGGGRDDRDRGRDRDGGRDGYREGGRDFGRENGRGSDRNDRDRDVEDKFGPSRPRKSNTFHDDKGSKSDLPPKRDAAAANKPIPASLTFMIVTVNDRLGTKASVPCLPSDTVGDFKKIVAAQIGRKPHEIMLKRQSERPFKDFITLGDYGVSNGVQLDLELDTGD
ncbi:ubiquitin-like protein [Venturia nashicola]|uniref:Ubiquitin-like modifier HUB1 n=1 Tax=Venturia nashicola TaxID=86259 RepID=A0A4Z1PAB2_9PEZI|nr:ubiquitin-like protein [Venturia nashicola]TLD38295.1 ubiquitin-like protein [Venturia nashicola]